MKLFRFVVLLTLANLSAFSAYAQDEPITVKTKGGVTIIKDKTKPIRRELEAVFEQRVRVENERDQVIEIDGKPANPDGSPKKPN